MFEPYLGALGAAHVVAAGSGCPGLDALNPVCQVANLGGTVASAGVDAVLSGLSQWVASGAEWLLSQIGDVLVSTTTIDVGAGWFTQHYGVMVGLSGVVVLPMLLVSTMQAIYRQSASQLLRAFFVQLPLALLLGAVAVQIVRLCLAATDALCTAVAGGSGSDIRALLSGVTSGLVSAVGDPTMATFVLLLVGLLVAMGAFVLWLELLVRAAAVYAAVLFLPLALATLVWPSVSHWCRRLVETLAALILSKFVIVATLSLAAGAVSSGTAGGAGGSGFASVLAGGALLVLSTFVPFTILRLIPMVEAGAIGHLEGARQRTTGALTRLPRTAASYALSGAVEGALQGRGAAKLLAQAGPVGSAGGSAGSAGSAAAGAGTSGGEAPDPGDSSAGESGKWWSTNADGTVSGYPGPNHEHFLAELDAAAQRPKGPKPVLPAPRFTTDGGGTAGGGTSAAPAPSPYIGNPGPNDNKYVIGHNAGGPCIRFVDDGERGSDA